MQQPDVPNIECPDDSATAPRSALLIVFLVVFIDLLGFGIVLPLLPLYASYLLTPLFPDRPDYVGGMLAVLMASFSFMQFLFAPIWGRISDRLGRRPILIIGLAGSVVFYALFAYASHLGFAGEEGWGVGLILLSRIGAGVAGATIATAQAVIADCTGPAERSRGMALIGAAFGIGFTFGPLLCFASFFVESKAAPGAAAALLSLIALVLAIVLLPETLRPGVGGGRRHWLKFNTLAEVLRMPTIGALVITFFLATVAFGSLEATLALMNQYLLSDGGTVRRLHEMSVEELDDIFRKSSLIFAYVGLTLMLVQGLIYRRLVMRVGELRFMRLGTFLMVVGLLGVIALVLAVAAGRLRGTHQTIPVALAILLVLVGGFALMTPSVQALISKRADPTRQGEILGANQSAAALARILGPAIGSWLFFASPSHVLPYSVGVVLMTVVFGLTLRLRD
ncbi:MAG: MFS transporter [Gemmataceae bacterium]|nr:MFS transporter [Gemmataceae bacterium]MDW8263717.1 MFS transporter [Gemmataceae bacterium]